MEKLIQIAKNLRKQKYLQMSYTRKYAFVGIGNHSINNLYPVLNYLRIPLKYIVTSSQKNASIVDQYFPEVIGTNDFEGVLNDPEIGGIFICAHPSRHFSLAKKALAAGKNVFVEKPPCESSAELEELIEAEKSSKGFCLVGVQKRYSPCFKILKQNLNNTSTYNLRFMSGSLPEGNPVLDMFIHPLDLITYLFGKGKITSVVRSGSAKKGAVTFFLHIEHGPVKGSVELSTDYSWSTAEESLIVNTSKGVYQTKNTEQLSFSDKPGTVLTIPREKILGHTPLTKILYHQNSFLPLINNNQIFSSGYYDELSTFVDLCEGKKGKNLSPLEALMNTYNFIEILKSNEYV